jgi:hypothetical protein
MLEELKKRFDGGRVEIVAIAWDVGAAKSLQMWGGVDAFLDVGLFEAAKSMHLMSGVLALRKGGKVVHWYSMLKGKVSIFFPLLHLLSAWLLGAK